jgi:hypothetical protein
VIFELGAVDVSVDELVAELALGVVLLDESLVVGHLCVELVETRRGNGEELGPVGAGVEGGELFFDEWEDGFDFRPLWLPGEVDGHGRALVGHAEPEVVGGDGAEFGDEEVRGDAVAELLDGEDGFVGAAPLLGVKLSLKWGRRSYQGPGTPSWSVQASALWSMMGCSLRVAALAPKNSGAKLAEVAPGSRRRLTQTSEMLWFCQSVKRLTL